MRAHRLPLPVLILASLVLATAGCRSVYYDVLEGFGKQKRHILADRVESSRGEQQAAQEQFQSALERFKEATGFEGGDLEDLYDDLAAELAACESRAEAVRARIDSIEQVAADLFSEWEDEITEISSAELRRRSAAQLATTRRRYAEMLKALRRAESKMDPVLVAFRDQVLFLKHNLNARAIASLEGSVPAIESDVAALVADMQAAIREAESFLATLEG